MTPRSFRALVTGLLFLIPSAAWAAPDLYVYSFTASVSSTTVTYKAWVCNKGTSTGATFDVELYYNRTSAPTCSTGANKTWVIKGLAAGKCVYRTYTRTKVASGSYTGWLRADADCKVKETSESNNNKSYKYSVVSLPDLYVSSLYTVSSGSKVIYYTTVCNAGPTTTKSFDIELYYNRSTAPGCSTTYSVQWKTYGLAKGKCVTRTHTRSGVSSGTYRAWARADADCGVSESNETNNNRSYKYYVGSLPDLYVYSFSATVSGSTVKYSATVCNKGSTTTKTFDIELYYNLNYSPGCSTTASRDFSVAGLGAGKCITKSYTRSSVAKGSYTGWARVDADCKVAESSEYNNNKYDKYIVGSTKPDLYLSSFAASVSGSTVTYKATACNKGTTTKSSFDIEIYYHRTSAPGCTTTYSYQWPISGLAAGKCVSKTYVRKGVPSGSYLGWARVDADCKVSESSETNNNRVATYKVGTTKPDLYVSSFTAKPSGSTVTYKATVCNKGATTSSSWDLELYFNTPSTPGCSTTSSTEWTISGLTTKACVTKSYVRSNVPNGAYTGWARADADCAVSETLESNNNKSAKYTVSSQKPDVYVKSFKAAVSGANADFTAEICNKGAAITKSFKVELFHHNGAAPGCPVKSDKSWMAVGMSAGKCLTYKYTRAGTPNGSYVGWIMADSDCNIVESTESNNTYAAVYNVAVTPDTGVVLPDQGVPPQPDQGVPPQPDQFIEPDQGQPEDDGGGQPEPDGEAAAPDQGEADLPGSDPDQGTTKPPGEEDDGCSCSLQRPPRRTSGAWLLLGLALVLAAFRIRRRLPRI